MTVPRFPLGALLVGSVVACVGACVVASTLACSSQKPSDSRDVATADLRISISVTDTTTETDVLVTLDGPGPYVTLVDGDRLDVTLAGSKQELEPFAGTYGMQYRGAFPRVGGDLLLELVRAGSRSDDRSLAEHFTVPPAFPLTVAAGPTGEVSRTAALTFSWPAGPGGYTQTLAITGACFRSVSRELGIDGGTYTLNVGELPALAGHEAESCTGTITLTHDATKQTGPFYFVAKKTETTTFTSVP